MPSLRQIRYFLTVADLGGFTAAARQLFIAQPALSRQIAQMEEEIGFTLFTREARGVRLTAAGEQFRNRVADVEKSLLAAVEESRQLDRGEGGVLRLLHSSSVPVDHLMPAIRRFAEHAPHARIDLDRLSSEQQITEIAAGKADLGIIRLPVLRRDPGVRLHELPAERLWAALPQGHHLAARESLTLAALAEEPFVSAVHRERGGLARRVTDLCLARGFIPRLAPVITRKTSMLSLVANNFGIALVPESMIPLAGNAVVFVPLADADASASAALVTPLDCSPLALRFIDLLLTPRENAEQ
jgi:DNA-binding transcriptional LysR family regulator